MTAQQEHSEFQGLLYRLLETWPGRKVFCNKCIFQNTALLLNAKTSDSKLVQFSTFLARPKNQISQRSPTITRPWVRRGLSDCMVHGGRGFDAFGKKYARNMQIFGNGLEWSGRWNTKAKKSFKTDLWQKVGKVFDEIQNLSISFFPFLKNQIQSSQIH